MPHVTIIRVYTTRVVRQHNELLISTLLLLILLIYLGMCPSIPTYIHPYMSKPRLLLEINDETNGLCLQWIPYMPGTTTQGVLLLVYGTSRKTYKILCPFRNVTRGKESVLLSDTWRPSSRSKSLCYTTYLIPL